MFLLDILGAHFRCAFIHKICEPKVKNGTVSGQPLCHLHFMRISKYLWNKTSWVLLAAFGVIAGCATQPKNKTTEYTFFPPAPDEPRIQFLTSFGSETDLGGQSEMSKFVLGKDRIIKPIWKPYGVTAVKGKLYICDTQPKNLTIVDLAKKKIDYFRPEDKGAFRMPINVAVDQDGTRYVADTLRGQVVISGPDNHYVGEIGGPGEMRPSGIAITPDRLYVSDLSNHCVRVYNKATREVLFTIPRKPGEEKPVGSSLSFGDITDFRALAKRLAPGSDPVSSFLYEHLPADVQKGLASYQGTEKQPIALDLPISLVRSLNEILKRETIYDETRFKGIRLRPETKELLQQKSNETDLTRLNRLLLEDAYPQELLRNRSRLFSPTNLAVDKEGKLYVCDTGIFMVKVFDPEGNCLGVVGDLGLEPGRFALPKGVAVDHEGRIYVVDSRVQNVQIFDREGRILMYFGDPKTAGALYLPAGIAIDYENVGAFQKYVAPGVKIEYLIYVANQAGSKKISVFGFMRKG